jgi:hypothetical protein
LKPTCFSGTTVIVNQSEAEPTMKRLSLFVATVIALAFPVLLSAAEQTNALPNGAKYIGETNLLPYGAEKYIGEMKDGKPNGLGKAISGAGTEEGEWRNGKLNGQGTQTWGDGTKFAGQFKNGQKFVGEWLDGSARQGCFTYADGSRYVGQLSGDMTMRRNGHGKMTYPDGRVEEGLWKDGKFMGASTTP